MREVFRLKTQKPLLESGYEYATKYAQKLFIQARAQRPLAPEHVLETGLDRQDLP